MRLLMLFPLITSAATVHGHGIVTKPVPRAPGAASIAACGTAITDIIKADNQSGIEVLHKASVTDPAFKADACNIALCKGLQLADNLANVQSYHPGQEVNIQVWTRIPHKGWVNVAIVDAMTDYPNLLVGEPLASFETDSVTGYGVNGGDVGVEAQIPSIDMDFNVTMPDLGDRCMVAGNCVLQWTWFGRVVKQTYESCIDFTLTPKTFEDESNTPALADLGQQKLSDQVLL